MINGLSKQAEINDHLMKRGLGSLKDPGLLSQLGFLVRDHEHLRQLLVKAEPEHRRAMYDSLSCNLRFKAKPLDVYLAEAGRDAEARQLPLIDHETGQFKPFKSPVVQHQTDGGGEIRSPEAQAAQNVLEELTANGHLTLVCRKCTKQAVFSGTDVSDAVRKARDAGWVCSTQGEGIEICPDCPAWRFRI